ncbi:hypothetical protein ACO22_07947 [Paracoccidioides brasiliensis]|uniref:Uncharacterized protein n=1 Tax=Paracoccidioides brasiliensis TaxID=121759 RepID=A0A1D2J366_PARBR|nr:hypothetical protein ACO22_07947 [Paracoccidioides brasiliensis]
MSFLDKHNQRFRYENLMDIRSWATVRNKGIDPHQGLRIKNVKQMRMKFRETINGMVPADQRMVPFSPIVLYSFLPVISAETSLLLNIGRLVYCPVLNYTSKTGLFQRAPPTEDVGCLGSK